MTQELPISRELKQIDELSSPLAGAIRERMTPEEPLELLISKPTERAGTEVSVPKALTITKNHFIFAEASQGGVVRAVRCSFDNVLLVEMATLLLYGHLKVDFVLNDVRNSIAMEFNTVAHDCYRKAAALILNGASRRRPSKSREPDGFLDFASWPDEVRQAVEFAILPGVVISAGAWWGSVRTGFAYELAPAGAVLARGNRLTIITIEQSGPWNRVRNESTSGIVATYLPAGHIASVQFHMTPKVTVIDLEMHAQHNGERYQLLVPNEQVSQVRLVIEQIVTETIVE